MSMLELAGLVSAFIAGGVAALITRNEKSTSSLYAIGLGTVSALVWTFAPVLFANRVQGVIQDLLAVVPAFVLITFPISNVVALVAMKLVGGLFQVHLSTAVVLMFVASFCLLVLVAAWRDLDEFENVPLDDLPLATEAAVIKRKQHAESVLHYGPPIALFVLVVIGAALQKNIRRRERSRLPEEPQ